MRSIWLSAWSWQLFDNLKTLRRPLEIRSCLGEAFLANTVVINQAADCEQDQPASLATCSSNRRLFALAAGNQLLVAHWLAPVPLPIKKVHLMLNLLFIPSLPLAWNNSVVPLPFVWSVLFLYFCFIKRYYPVCYWLVKFPQGICAK